MPTLTLSKWSTQAGGVLDVDTDEGELLDFLGRLRALPQLSPDSYLDAVNAFARQSGRDFSKAELVHGYRQLVTAGKIEPDRRLEQGLRLKPVRTSSGVAPVTVLTKPYACPGECIFCPTFVSMPKSYVPDEPGSLRALQNEFDPFRQTSSRLHSFRQVGHSTDKVELLILGGTWSAYPRDYQSWFVQRCLDAMNGCDSVSLAEARITPMRSTPRRLATSWMGVPGEMEATSASRTWLSASMIVVRFAASLSGVNDALPIGA